jgi:murein DD-endopeptidase MepM/ murein hydrolase activator NlpD
MVEINHSKDIKTRYGHLKKILVKKGQKVKVQQKIGLLGNSGRSTGPHLHYEILFRGKPMNPKQFIKAGRYVFKN